MAGLSPEQPASDFKGKRTAGIPVLMYHIVGNAPADARYPDLYVKAGDFAQQLNYLAEHGYHPVTLQQVYDFWHHGGTLPDKPVVLSFDDGDYQDFTVVAPLLKEQGWPGVMNLIVGRSHPRLKPSIVRALIAAGWEIDSHTISHDEVRGMSASQLAFEIAGSRKKLQKMYHVPVNFFCYPSGSFDAAAVAAVKQAGYLGATTTLHGLARPGEPFLMRRIRVLGGESVDSFASLLSETR
jgi:peptidoglycan/xylan/chitin deacetylase (PgdA/CDA1 family)